MLDFFATACSGTSSDKNEVLTMTPSKNDADDNNPFPIKTPETITSEETDDTTTPSTSDTTTSKHDSMRNVESIEVTPDEVWSTRQVVINGHNINSGYSGVLKKPSHRRNVSDVTWKETSLNRIIKQIGFNEDENNNDGSSPVNKPSHRKSISERIFKQIDINQDDNNNDGSSPMNKSSHRKSVSDVSWNPSSNRIYHIDNNNDNNEHGNLHKRHVRYEFDASNNKHEDSNLKDSVHRLLRDQVLQDDEIKKKLIEVLQESMMNHTNDEDIEKQRNNYTRTASKFLKNYASSRSNNTVLSNKSNGSFHPWNYFYSRPVDSKKEYSSVDRIRCLEDDTFTLMMLSTRYGFAWMFLFCLFLVQVCLLIGILSQLVFDRDFKTEGISRALGVPIANHLFVTIGQLLAIIFALFSQRDLLEGVNVFIALWSRENWQQLNVLPDGKMLRWYDLVFWYEKVFTSYMMKLSVSFLTLFTAMVLILQSTDLIDLLKDFTALFIVASLDNFVYSSIGDGYFGHLFDVELKRQDKIRIKAETRYIFCLCWKVPLQSFFFGLTLSIMLTTWGYVGYMQQSGTYFFEAHPYCTAFDNKNMTTTLKYEYWGDSVCDPRFYAESCGMDGGDCSNYCMIKWMNPSPKLWVDVQERLESEKKPNCGINETIVTMDGDGVVTVNGIIPLNSSSFKFGNLNEEFSKCFEESSIYNENDSTLGLFCYFGDFMQELSGRSDVNVEVRETSASYEE